MLGIVISDGYVAAVKRSIAYRALRTNLQQEAKGRSAGSTDDPSDDRFAYIAGRTSGGAPYGITWKELKVVE
jgi:hypothetical protein